MEQGAEKKMKRYKMLKAITVSLLIFCIVALPMRFDISNFLKENISIAEDEEYPGEIEGEVTWGSEHAVVDYDVTVYEGAALTLEQGNYDFQGVVNLYPGSKLVLKGGEYFFKKGIFADNSNMTLEKGNYTFEGDLVLNNNSKLTIKSGANIKFKKTGEYTPIMQLTESVIIAEGSADDMIAFEAADENSNNYSINIEGYGSDTSVFKYVNFKGGGDSWGGGQALLKNFFINTARAAEGIDGVATLDINNGNVSVENSKFEKNNYYGINYEWFVDINDNRKSLLVTDSDFTDNANKLAVNSQMICQYGDQSLCNTIVTLKNNFYDSADGPKAESNPFGTGNEVSGPVNLEGWNIQSNFSEIVSEGPSNVLFLPGLEASRLYAKDDPDCLAINCENQLWEPNRDGDVKKLFLDEDGKSTYEYDIYTRDIIDEANVLPQPYRENIYKSFIAKMDDLKSSNTISNWSAYAYDWRMPLDKILEDNSLENKLKELAASSKSKKVTIIAHSNGGLLTKALLHKLGSDEIKSFVDKIIFVAVPQVGTPDAIAAMLHGKGQNIFPVLSKETARNLAVNMSSAYNLLPSEAYFSTVQTPVVTFDQEKCSVDWKDRYAEEINNKNDLDNFLIDDFRRSLAMGTTLNVPLELNRTLLEKANDQHESLDEWNTPDGVKIIQIAGWGVPATISSIKYESENGKLCNSICQYGLDVLEPEEFSSTIDGDGTVVTPSALWMGGAERYWVNAQDYNKNHRIETLFGALGIEHKNILEIPELNNFIADNITNSEKPLSEYKYLSTEVPPSDDERRLQYTLHSPLTLELFDDQERYTGIDEEGNVEEQIPGTYYSEIGETKNIFTSDEFPGRIKMKGYDEGKFTFSIKEYQGDEEKGKITFKDMPVTSETKVYFNTQSDLESASNLEIDKDGDGDIDYSLEPKIGEIVTLDTTPPTTEATLAGTNENNDWYTSDVSLTLTAKDDENGSGIEKTEYSTDNGSTWTTYTNPVTFTQEGIIEVQYRSTDKQGNQEEIKTITIKIDKTAPEAKISFGNDNKKLNITGIDNLSQNVSVVTKEEIIKEKKEKHKTHNFWSWNWFPKNDNKKIMETTTLTDDAGHQTDVVLKKKKDRNGFIDASVKSISYDGQTNDLTKNNLQYKWSLNGWKNKYLFFASSLRTSSMIVEAHYLPKLDQTWIMEWPRDLADDEKDEVDKRPVRKKMPGMVIPGIITNKGELQVNY